MNPNITSTSRYEYALFINDISVHLWHSWVAEWTKNNGDTYQLIKLLPSLEMRVLKLINYYWFNETGFRSEQIDTFTREYSIQIGCWYLNYQADRPFVHYTVFNPLFGRVPYHRLAAIVLKAYEADQKVIVPVEPFQLVCENLIRC